MHNSDNQPVTQKVFEEFAQSIKRDFNRMENRMATMESRMDTMENRMATKDDLFELEQRLPSKQQINKLYNLVDSVARDVKNIKEENTAHIAAHDRFEKRITRIEKHIGLKPLSF